MKKDELTYWLQLADRYFEATATDEEEQLLKRFLATKEADDPRFDEVRAVMGIFAAHRRQAPVSTSVRSLRSAATRRWAWVGAAAAAVVAICFTVSEWANRPTDICVAYVNGVEITNRDEVLAMMHSSFESVGMDDGTSVVADELGDLFASMDEDQ